METPSVRQLNPFIREFVRKGIKIPVLNPIEGCSWPGGSCETRIQKHLIESSSGETLLERVQKYSLKSLDDMPKRLREDPQRCTLGPEFQNLISHPTELKTLADAFLEWVGSTEKMTRAQKTEYSREIVKRLESDIRQRTWTLLSYILYFSITLFLLLQQVRQGSNLPAPPAIGSSAGLLVAFLIPMISGFYLQTLYSERLRGTGFLHLLPILLLTTYAAYSIMLSQGTVSSVWKYSMFLTQIAVLGITFYTFYYTRRLYDDCLQIQTGGAQPKPMVVTLLIFGGIALPVLLTTWMSYNL